MKNINKASLILIGIVPLLGTTGRLYYAFWSSLCFLAVLLLSSLAAWLTRKLIRGRMRLIAYAGAAAGFTAAADLLLRAYVPAAGNGIGVCLSFLAANGLVVAVCEASAESGFKASVENVLVCGLSGAAVLLAAAAVRELLQYGTVFSGFGEGTGVRIFSDWFSTIGFAGTSAGALIIFGLTAACAQKISVVHHRRQWNHTLRKERIVSGSHPDLVVDASTGKIVRRSTAELLNQQRQIGETYAEKDSEENKTDAEISDEAQNKEKAYAENGGGEDSV